MTKPVTEADIAADFLLRLRGVDRDILVWIRDVLAERDTLRARLAALPEPEPTAREDGDDEPWFGERLGMPDPRNVQAAAIGHIDGAHNHDADPVCRACGVGLRVWAATSSRPAAPELRAALERIAAWSRHHKDEARTQLRGTMRLIHEEALRAVPTALASVTATHFDGGRGVCVADGESMPCSALSAPSRSRD